SSVYPAAAPLHRRRRRRGDRPDPDRSRSTTPLTGPAFRSRSAVAPSPTVPRRASWWRRACPTVAAAASHWQNPVTVLHTDPTQLEQLSEHGHPFGIVKKPLQPGGRSGQLSWWSRWSTRWSHVWVCAVQPVLCAFAHEEANRALHLASLAGSAATNLLRVF